MAFSATAALLFLILQNATGALVLDLGGTWNLRDKEGEFNLNGTIPGGVYGDLMRGGIIGDVFWRYNDVETRWVATKDWIYSRNFTVPQELLAYDNINLVLEGIDTFATIFINWVEVGSTDNMFVRYQYHVKTALKEGRNTIYIHFRSPVKEAADLYRKQAVDYVVPPVCVPKEYNGVCHVNHIRKMQASFGWDWGPALPSSGIWKPMYIEAYNSAVIKDVTVSTTLNNKTESWDVRLTTYLANLWDNTVKGTIVIRLDTDVQTLQEIYDVELSQNQNGEFVDVHSFSVPELYVKLWWPNGYGNATLYPMKITFTNEDETETSVRRIKVGFRTVELIQKDIANVNGSTFYFIVNNVPIFAKGANSIPLSLLPERGQNSSTINFLLQSAKDVHMNMLRVWGGGVYESDEFYETADELGILIWQDFMFACSMYPTGTDFLRSVTQEVRSQVRRLQYHPSIALWAANNENEAALRQNWYNTVRNFSLYKQDYIKLYVETVRAEVLKSDTSRPFLTSSPTNGAQSEREGYVAKNPSSTMYGDVHHYDYLADAWDQNALPVPRFSSEYGYQSLPSISTWLTATNNLSDLHFDSAFMKHRQHHSGGYSQIKTLIKYQLDLPPADDAKFTRAFIFYSQVIQAMAYKRQTEYYRLWRSNLNSNSEGLTMGALYWQLNDVWVAPTWSGIDFQNKWKMLHYFAKDFFAPVIITSYFEADRNLKVFVVSDLTVNIYNATVTLYVHRWSSLEAVHNESFRINVVKFIYRDGAMTLNFALNKHLPESYVDGATIYFESQLGGLSSVVTTFWLDQFLSTINNCGPLSQAKHNCFIRLTLQNENGLEIAPDNHVFPCALKEAAIQKSTARISTVRSFDLKGLSFEVEVVVNATTLFIWLDSGDVRGTFSRNGFLQINQTETVRFNPEKPSTLIVVKAAVTVTHLLDSEFV